MEKSYAEYLLKKIKDDYNLIAEDFSRTRKVIWEELRILQNYLFAGEKVLDLGCGNGRLYQLFKDISVDYYGLDISEKLIKIARDSYPEAKFYLGNALNLPFPNNFFDKVFSVAVFHHIPSTEFRLQFLKETKRVLRPEGKLILIVWDLWQWWSLRFLLKNSFLKIIGKSQLDFRDAFFPWENSIQRYIHFFTKRELIKITEKVSFKMKEMKILRSPRAKGKNIFLVVQK